MLPIAGMTEQHGNRVFTNGSWAIWEPLIEAVRPHGRTPPEDLRGTIPAIFWRHRNGARWRSVPAEPGPWWRRSCSSAGRNRGSGRACWHWPGSATAHAARPFPMAPPFAPTPRRRARCWRRRRALGDHQRLRPLERCALLVRHIVIVAKRGADRGRSCIRSWCCGFALDRKSLAENKVTSSITLKMKWRQFLIGKRQ